MGSNSRRLTMGSYGEFGEGSIIYYSSINSDIVTPYSTTAFGDARIIHNIYNNDIGEIKFDRELTTIGINAFYKCSKLASVVIPDSVTSIRDKAFYQCSNLTSLTLPDSVTSIGYNAFNSCTRLTGELIIPDSVISINHDAFRNCSGLTSLTLGSGVTSIGSNAFGYCSGLTGELVIPDSVSSIGYGAFHSCVNLTSLTLGSGVTSIGDTAFRYCIRLTSITCKSPIAPSIYSDSFRNVENGGILYYPLGSDYSKWLSTTPNYLGYYNWTGAPIQMN